MACSDIGVSRKQTVFAVAETVCGTLQFPSATDFIIPAGNASINQTPEFADSEEIRNSLDVLAQFQNAMPAGEFTIPMYARPAGTVGGTPQGDPLFKSLQGSSGAVSGTTLLKGAIDEIVTSMTIDGLTSRPPFCGVITIGTEKIYYAKAVYTSSSGEAALTGCVRAYDSTSAASHADNDPVSWSNKWYKQSTSSPSFSVWAQTDHFTQGLSGCSVNSCTVSVTNEGAVMVEFSGQGMQMVWAGTCTIATQTDSGETVISVPDADIFSAGAYVYYEKGAAVDNRTNQGYKITAVDTALDTITVANAIAMDWEVGGTISGYLPTGTEVGTPIESRYTGVMIDSVDAIVKSGDITFDTPKEYITDEIGLPYPTAYVENVRSITSSLGLYFRKNDAKYFSEGYSGTTKPIKITFGETAGSIMEFYGAKAQFTVPTVEITSPTVSLTMPIKFLGTDGEDSMDIIFR
jgi:hypothetical protein